MNSLVRSLRGLRALARVELRQFRHHPRRSALVMMLVALPVATAFGGATLALIIEKTVEEQRSSYLGRADLRIDGVEQYEDLERATALLPTDAKIEAIFVGQEEATAPGVRLRARLIAAPPKAFREDGLANGMLHFTDGRAPEHAGEVALSPAMLEGLGRQVGEKTTLEFGAVRTITGVVVNPEELAQPVIVRTPAASEYRGAKSLLVRLNNPGAELEETLAELRGADFSVSSRPEVGVKSDTPSIIFVLGVIGFFEAALVIAAAFSVGVRRRQREIGLLSASGADGRGIWGSLLVSAAGVAIAGGAIGALVAVGGTFTLHPFLDGWNERWNGPVEFSLGHLFGALVLGVLTAIAAAAVPAWNVARLPIRTALSSRRPPRSGSKRPLFFGVPMIVIGALLTAATRPESAISSGLGVVVGPILATVGFGVSSPWILEVLARQAHRLPLSWRLAVRDAGRFRSRNGPVVTAILAGMAMSVTIAALVASLDQAIELIPPPYRDDQLLVQGMEAEAVAREVAQKLGAIAFAPLQMAHSQGAPVRVSLKDPDRRRREPTIACGGDDLLSALGAEQYSEAFHAGRLLDLYPSTSPTEIVFSTWVDEKPLSGPEVSRAPVDQGAVTAAYVLHEDTLAEHRMVAGAPLTSIIIPWIIRLPEPVTPSLLSLAQEVASDSLGTTVDAALLHQRPAGQFFYIVLALSVLTGLGIVLIANALSAAESADDSRVLHTVGASPTVVRRHAAARAGYLALLGCLLAIPAGLLPAVGLFAVADISMEFVMPWTSILLALLLLPSVAYSTAWWTGRKADGPRRLERALVLVGLASLTALAGSQPLTAQESATSSSREIGEIQWEPYRGKAFDGSPLEGELGRLTVPENRVAEANGGSSGTIELAFVRYRTSRPNPGPPIFFLAGGPGGAGGELLATIGTHPQIRLLELADLIGIDQRGTGRSVPNLVDQSFSETLSFDRPATRDDFVAALHRVVREATSYGRSRDIDPTAYNTAESADDIEDVRRALGLDRIILFGGSYGSHLGLSYLRRHGERVERAVLLRAEGPDDTWKLPSATQAGLERLAAQIRSDPSWSDRLPDLEATLRGLLDELTTEPVTITVAPDEDDPEAKAGKPPSAQPLTQDIVVGPYDLQTHVALKLSGIEGITELPSDIYEMTLGKYSALAESALESRNIEINAMTLWVDCASGATAERRRRIERERRDPTLLASDALTAPFYPEGCDGAGHRDLGDDFRSSFESSVPTLFVSGAHDIRTPPGNVDKLLPGFSRGVHIVIENASHGFRELMTADYRRLLHGFLRGEEVKSTTITLPPPRLDPLDPDPSPE